MMTVQAGDDAVSLRRRQRDDQEAGLRFTTGGVDGWLVGEVDVAGVALVAEAIRVDATGAAADRLREWLGFLDPNEALRTVTLPGHAGHWALFVTSVA